MFFKRIQRNYYVMSLSPVSQRTVHIYILTFPYKTSSMSRKPFCKPTWGILVQSLSMTSPRYPLTLQPHYLLITCFENQIHTEVSSKGSLLVREISLLKVLRVHEQCSQYLKRKKKSKKEKVYTVKQIFFCVKAIRSYHIF